MFRRERKTIDISSNPELLRLVREMQASDQVLSLRDADREVAVLTPARPASRSRRKGRPTSEDDPIWEIVGMIDGEGPGDVSENVDAYLAEANLPRDL